MNMDNPLDLSELEDGPAPAASAAEELAYESLLAGKQLESDCPIKDAQWRSQMENSREPLEEVLAFALNCDVTLSVAAYGSMQWQELVGMMKSGGIAGVGRTGDGKCGSAVWFGPLAAGVVLETALGGSAKNAFPLSRDIRELERDFVWDLLQKAWKIVLPAETRSEGIGTAGPSFEILPVAEIEQAVKPDSAAHCAEFKISFGEGAEGNLLVMASSDSLNASSGKPVDAYRGNRPWSREARNRRLERLGALTVDLEVKLEGNSIAFSDLVNLQVGDVIGLESDLDQALSATLNSVNTFEGRIVSSGARKSFQIDRVVTPAP
jgi:flagellar motor switch protein FliM